MSQRECSGFNWPGDRRPAGGISAEDPLGIPPESASCACRDREVKDTPIAVPSWRAAFFLARKASGVPPASWAAGVAHVASRATSLSGRALSPCLLLAPDFQSRAVGVGQLAVCAVVGRSCPVLTRRFPPLAPSLARAVGHAAS